MKVIELFSRVASRPAASFVAAAWLLTSCGITDDSLGRAPLPILDGATDTGDPAVVAVDAKLPTGEELCTGYLITPDLVLTARHCAAPVVNPSGPCETMGTTVMASGGEPLDASKLGIVIDATWYENSKILPVAEVTVLPDSVGASMCGNDLAILRLSTPIEGIDPIPLRVASPPDVGEGFTAIGYGLSDPSDLNTSGIRRSRGGLTVSSVGASDRTSDGEWIADTGPCGGDSGSPAIDADGASFGVMTRGQKSTCISMIYERVDTHADFLIDQARASATRLGIDPPGWAAEATNAGGARGTGASGTGGTDARAPTKEDAGCSVGTTGELSGSIPALLALALLARRRRLVSGIIRRS